MSRLGISAACLAAAAAAGLTAATPADARVTLLDDDRAGLERLVGVQPGGGAGITARDNAYQVGLDAPALPSGRRAARVPGAPLAALTPDAIAERLREAIAGSGAGAVIVDDVGAAFRGAPGDALADALERLGARRADVSLYVAATGATFTDPAWAGARAAMSRAGRVWLKTGAGGRQWTAAEWLAWPREAARVAAAAARRGDLHVAFGAGDQASAWSRARTGYACTLLRNGPAAYRLGGSSAAFVAEYRRAFPSPKGPPAPCAPAPLAAPAVARAVEGLVGREASGVAIQPLLVPPLVAGEPAQLTVQLGADPLGLADALGVAPERMWEAARARLRVTAPGVVVDVPVEGDGAARLGLTPAAAGPVTMRLVLPAGPAVRRAAGRELDLVGALEAAGAARAAIDRVVADPESWGADMPVQAAGSAPGSPVLQVLPAA
ncbi:hypothetical protein [Miltoncostaea marina]|uniref:hypothetical protein n=1 Tax=Miltoncostaea marina TaxID=2843215 RepID=UPI001C3DB46F|nr:hypothetical protein [Miltoncostaea marina]